MATPNNTQAPQVATPALQSASLYVGDLNPDVTEPILSEVFSAIGPLESVRVCRDSATRRSLGYAYVNFYKLEDAERALDTLNFKAIRDRPCRVMWSHRDPSLRKSGVGNIFVKSLSKSIDNKSLYDTFSVFGNILSCKVATNPKGESLGYGFVHFETAEAAQTAIQRVDGKVIADEKVNVAAFKTKKDRGVDKKARFTNLYAKNLPMDWTKQKVDEMFGKHGNITSSMVSIDKESKRAPFAFINFAAPEEATAALNALNNMDLGDNKKLYVSRAQKKEERVKELRQRFEQMKAERLKKSAGANLYVKNLPDDFDDDRLRNEFKGFGGISSAKVMRDEKTSKSRGFGFVCFANPEEATKAVSDMNGKLFDGKPLYVSLAQRKEVRRATLENRRMARGGGQMGQYPPQMYPGQPMFYGDMQRQQGFMGYPQMGMGRGGWPQMQGQGMMRQGFGGYPPMMHNGRGGPTGPGSPGGRGRGGRGQPRGGGNQQQGQPMNRMGPRQPMNAGPNQGHQGQNQGQGPAGRGEFKGQQPPQNFQYETNVRNPQNRPMQAPANMQSTDVATNEPVIARAPAGEPLTIKALAAATEKQQKQMIGEQLFPRIKAIEPKLAGKITGMLLEMDNGELIHLLESQQALQEKVSEAKDVLEHHETPASGDAEEEETE